MKCHKPNTDQEAFLEVYANGHRCPEYVHPSSAVSDPNILECFIPVSDGEKITIKGSFDGTVLTGCIDLLVDGSYLADKRIENKELRFNSRKIDFVKAYDVPMEDGRPDLPYENKDVVEGSLQVSHLESQKELQDLPAGSGRPEFGVGTLAIVISVSQDASDTYLPNPPYPDMSCSAWRDRGDYEGSEGIIVPTHEVILAQSNKEVHFNAKSKHRRHFKGTRSGSKPWAKFLFYYRSHSAITAAGCTERPDLSQALEPDGLPENTQETLEGTQTSTAAKAAMKKPKLGGYYLFGNQPAPPPTDHASMGVFEDTSDGQGEIRSFRNSSVFVNDDDDEDGQLVTAAPSSAASHARTLGSAAPPSPAPLGRSLGSPVPSSAGSLKRKLDSPLPPSPRPLQRGLESLVTPSAGSPLAGSLKRSVDSTVFPSAGLPMRSLDATITPSTGSLKRGNDSPDTSREDTPSKKLRMSDRRAALLAEIEETKRKKSAEEEQLKQRRKIVEDEQRKLEDMEAEELEELRKVKAALDAEYMEVGKANAEVQERIMELRAKQQELQQ